MKIINQFLKEDLSEKDFRKRDSAKAIVFDDTRQILLVRRQNDDAGAGKWDLPGGGIEKNENPIDTIQREVFEETNLHVTNIKKDVSITLKIPECGVNSQINIYTCNATTLDVRLKPAEWNEEGTPEHNEYKWISSKIELENIPMLDILKKEIMRHLN